MGEVERSVPVYPIGIVQNLTQLSGRQIRYYEQQSLLLPQRTKGNQRLYSADDVDILLRIKQLLADGLSIEGVRASLAEAIPPPQPAESHSNEPRTASEFPRRLPAGAKLDSLYPVNNQAALRQMLESQRDTDTKGKS